MKLLLDTHIWIWSLLEPARLSSRVRRVLASADHELWLSSISIWEFLLLAERGRVKLDRSAPEWLDAALLRAPVGEAPVTHQIARQSRCLDLTHDDPADRFIAATTLVLGLTLITADTRLLASKSISTMANT